MIAIALIALAASISLLAWAIFRAPSGKETRDGFVADGADKMRKGTR